MAFKFILVLVLAALAVGIPANRSSAQNKLKYNMDQKSPYVLGDIRFVDWQLDETKGAIVNSPAKYWPGGKIPYIISTTFSARELVVIQEAIAHYNMNTCIRLVPRTPLDKNYIHILKGEDCDSNLGMVGGEQTVSLGTDCIDIGSILHELGHTIGLLPEHNRYDRDEYLEIHWDNIPDEVVEEYKRREERDERICNKTHDCNSIMHYGPYAPDGIHFAMTARFLNCTLGDFRDHLSELDKETIACAYCSGKPSRSFKD